jgi:hypothetical protein
MAGVHHNVAGQRALVRMTDRYYSRECIRRFGIDKSRSAL